MPPSPDPHPHAPVAGSAAPPYAVTSLEVAIALPVGTVLAAHERDVDLPDDSVWVVIAPNTAQLISHHTQETESIDWFMRDGGTVTVWSLPPSGDLPALVQETIAGLQPLRSSASIRNAIGRLQEGLAASAR